MIDSELLTTMTWQVVDGDVVGTSTVTRELRSKIGPAEIRRLTDHGHALVANLAGPNRTLHRPVRRHALEDGTITIEWRLPAPADGVAWYLTADGRRWHAIASRVPQNPKAPRR